MTIAPLLTAVLSAGQKQLAYQALPEELRRYFARPVQHGIIQTDHGSRYFTILEGIPAKQFDSADRRSLRSELLKQLYRSDVMLNMSPDTQTLAIQPPTSDHPGEAVFLLYADKDPDEIKRSYNYVVERFTRILRGEQLLGDETIIRSALPGRNSA